MIYSDEVRNRIIEYLRIKPINHGQVHISQIAIPPALVEALDPARVEAAIAHLERFGSNLHPVILRRTNLYGENREYEVVFGEEWCEAANRLGWERIWTWVFDIADDQIDEVRRCVGGQETRSGEDSRASKPPEAQASTSALSSIPAEDLQQGIKGILQGMLQDVFNEMTRLREEMIQKLDQLLNYFQESHQLKNINTVTEAELASLDNAIVRRNAQKIYEFIQQQNGLVTLHQLKTIKGIGDKTVAYLEKYYKCG